MLGSNSDKYLVGPRDILPLLPTNSEHKRNATLCLHVNEGPSNKEYSIKTKYLPQKVQLKFR